MRDVNRARIQEEKKIMDVDINGKQVLVDMESDAEYTILLSNLGI